MLREFDGPAGKLVGELELPDGAPVGAAIACHPHPLHGGSLRNTIVVRTARALRTVGFATLRFNFRGVEGSAGTHDGSAEVEDAAAALAVLERELPGLPLWGAGYSFGSRMVLELALRGAVERVVLIAPPIAIYDLGGLRRLRTPGLLVSGGADAFGSAEDLRLAFPDLPPALRRVEIPGADHFFRGRTPLVEEAVLEYARAVTA
jgi:alpha/beta superfamily hydrolase